MFNKIYEKIKEFIKDNFKFIISYIFVILCLVTPLPYYVLIGGGTINISDRIDMKKSYKEEGNFNLAYVKQVRATIPSYLLSYIISDWQLETIESYSIDEKESVEEISKRDKVYLENATSSAIKVAYNLANKPFNIKNKYYNVIYISNEAETNIKIGDIITKLNGKKINDINEYADYVKELNYGDKVNLTVERNGKEKEVYTTVKNIEGEKISGLSILTTYDYITNPKFNLKFANSESGPSGGFITALAIYNKITNEDITKGKKIVGTGTIDENGNIGEIGGITYKLKGAVKSKADIFFAPSGNNYIEAVKYKKKKKYNIEIVEVKNITDAIKYLEAVK